MRVYISYSPDDEGLKNELLKHLAPAIRAGALSPWDPGQVRAGDEVSRVIEAELERAEVALVVLSASYLAKGGPAERDLPRIEARRVSGGLREVPIILSACDWQADVHLKGLQVLPRDERPLRSRRDRDEAFMEVCREIVALASEPSSSKPEVRVPLATDALSMTSVTISPQGRHPPSYVAPSLTPSPNWRNPISVLSAAIAAVPVMKYALGVAGLAGVVAIATRGFGLDPPTATLGALIVMALMTVLIVLAVAARQSKHLMRQAVVLTWFFLILTLGSSALLLLSLFFQWPRPLRCLIHEEQCKSEKRGRDEYVPTDASMTAGSLPTPLSVNPESPPGPPGRSNHSTWSEIPKLEHSTKLGELIVSQTVEGANVVLREKYKPRLIKPQRIKPASPGHNAESWFERLAAGNYLLYCSDWDRTHDHSVPLEIIAGQPKMHHCN